MDSGLTVKEWMQTFYRERMFADNAEEARWIFIRLGFMKLPFPNPKQRRKAIWLHDLNHLVTGYDTSWTGEGEIAAFELASGFPSSLWIGYVYPPMTFSIGLIIAPLRTLSAFRKGIGQKNVYKLQMERENLERMRVVDLKRLLS